MAKPKRKLKANEIALIIWMIKDTSEGTAIIDNLDELFVQEMDDGGMGSLRVATEAVDQRKYGSTLADVDLYDADGMLLMISVILDTSDNFYELDVFKGDFSPIIQFPSIPL